MPTRCRGACFGEAAVARLDKGKVHFLVLGEFRRLPCNTMCSHSERHSSGVKKTYVTAEAFFLPGVLRSKDGGERRIIAE